MRFNVIKAFCGVIALLATTTNLASQKIGINNPNPTARLSLKDAVGSKISFWGNATGAHYGMAVTNSEWQIFSDASFTYTVFGTGSSSNFSEIMRLTGENRLGIGITNPQYAIDMIGRIRFSSFTDIVFDPEPPYYPSYVYTPAALHLNGQANGNPLARIGCNAGFFGIYRNSDNRLLYGLNPNGALLVNGTAGNQGDVLMSNGFNAAPSWEKDVLPDMYANQHHGYAANILQLINNGDAGTMSFVVAPPVYGSEDALVVNTNSACKALVKFALRSRAGCCGYGYFQVSVLDNNVVKRNFRFSIPADQTSTATGTVLLPLTAGAHSFTLRVTKISGPTLYFDISNLVDLTSTLCVERITGKTL